MTSPDLLPEPQNVNEFEIQARIMLEENQISYFNFASYRICDNGIPFDSFFLVNKDNSLYGIIDILEEEYDYANNLQIIDLDEYQCYRKITFNKSNYYLCLFL